MTSWVCVIMVRLGPTHAPVALSNTHCSQLCVCHHPGILLAHSQIVTDTHTHCPVTNIESLGPCSLASRHEELGKVLETRLAASALLLTLTMT